MAAIKTVRDAKDYIAGLIAEQAEREGAPLTEIERTMLYFTEIGGLSKAMAAVSAEFDRDYDQDAYEARIGGLVSRLIARDENDQLRENWDAAIDELSRGDHYLLILLDAAPSRIPSWPRIPAWLKPWLPSDRPTGVRGILLVIVWAFAFIAVVIMIAAIKARLFD